MSARIARRAFTATARRSVLKPSSVSRVACRRASTSSSHGSEPASDKPWIVSRLVLHPQMSWQRRWYWQIGSLLIFGPAVSLSFPRSQRYVTWHPPFSVRCCSCSTWFLRPQGKATTWRTSTTPMLIRMMTIRRTKPQSRSWWRTTRVLSQTLRLRSLLLRYDLLVMYVLGC